MAGGGHNRAGTGRNGERREQVGRRMGGRGRSWQQKSTPYPSSILFPHSPQTCASKITGADQRRSTGGLPRGKGTKMSLRTPLN